MRYHVMLTSIRLLMPSHRCEQIEEPRKLSCEHFSRHLLRLSVMNNVMFVVIMT
jgi:hypothetical protein